MLHMWNLDSRSEIEISEVYIKTDIVTIINECTIFFLNHRFKINDTERCFAIV